MSNASEIRTGRHVIFTLHTHLVFVTKYRKPILTKPMLKSESILTQDAQEKLNANIGEEQREVIFSQALSLMTAIQDCPL